MIASLPLRAPAFAVVLTAAALPASAMDSQQVPGPLSAALRDGGATMPGAAYIVPTTFPVSAIPVSALPGSAPETVPATLPAPRPMGFLQRQLVYPRVQRAYERKAERIEATLDARGVEDLGEVFFRVFKREQELEVWAREPGAPTFTQVKTYPVCEISGRLGPKRRQGDLQIPEGFYSIDIFNPWSNFHLSMRVDYPNAVDRARGSGGPLGGDIYIHGGCVTIGCVPVTDEYIEEIYLIAAAARDAGQHRIPVHIFPTRLDDAGLKWLADHYGTRHIDYPFWQNLQQGYLAFEQTRQLPPIGNERDRYTFGAPPSTRSAQVLTSDPLQATPVAPATSPSGR